MKHVSHGKVIVCVAVVIQLLGVVTTQAADKLERLNAHPCLTYGLRQEGEKRLALYTSQLTRELITPSVGCEICDHDGYHRSRELNRSFARNRQ